MNETPLSVLQKYWGFTTFRPLQEEILQAALDGKDVMAILPTGGGKSVCFQVPALLQDGLCLVVSPLLALMRDQVENLKSKGIHALSISSVMPYREMENTLREAAYGSCKFLYVSPERLQNRLFREYLPALPLNLLAVDEAHCISQWGYDFRPSYLKIEQIRDEKPDVPIMALTASATREVQEDIIEKLRLEAPRIFRQSFERPNLSYRVIRVESKINQLRKILQEVPGPAIVYCRSRRKTVEIAGLLKLHGISSDFYHAGLPADERNRRQSDWIENQTRVMVCTNAFGMGIDKPDVRAVIHIEAPECLENYYQEAGRAGRDGKKSFAVLLEPVVSVNTLDQQLAIRFPAPEVLRNIYEDLGNYFQLPSGLGEEQYFEFDLNEFSRRFHHSPVLLNNTLQALQQEEILYYHDQIFLPATVQVIAGREEMTEFEFKDPDTAAVLKTLLRTYGGILDQPAGISEKQLGNILKKSKDGIVEALKKLHALALIRYQPQKDKPLIRFLQNRVRPEELSFNLENYNKRKNSFAGRWQAMQNYIQTAGCRSVYIGRYFGDDSIRPCGICDECLRNIQHKTGETDFETINKQLKDLLLPGPRTFDEILGGLNAFPEEKIKEVLDYLVGENQLRMEKNGRIAYKKNGPG